MHLEWRMRKHLLILILDWRGVCVKHLHIVRRWGWRWCCGALLDTRGTGEQPGAPVIEGESDRERHDVASLVADAPCPNTSSITCCGWLDELVVLQGSQSEVAGALALLVSSDLDTQSLCDQSDVGGDRDNATNLGGTLETEPVVNHREHQIGPLECVVRA
jgi:hypothetical protein